MDAVDLLPVLNHLKELAPTEQVSLLVLMRFMTLAARFRHDIALNQPSTAVFDDDIAPMFLDDGTRSMLCAVLSISTATADVLWTVTGQVVWTGQTLPEVIHDKDIEDIVESLKIVEGDGPLVRCE